MTKLKESTQLWWANRVRDPVLRKQIIDNKVAYSHGDYETGCMDIMSMFSWGGTPEGFEYWSTVHYNNREGKIELLDNPILDNDTEEVCSEYTVLPDEYWVENPWPGRSDDATTEFHKLAKKLDSTSFYGTSKWYRWKKGKRDYGMTVEPTDGLPILTYQNWKNLIEPPVKTYKVGDYVCLVEGAYGHYVGTTGRIIEVHSQKSIGIMVKNKGGTLFLMGKQLRYATQAEIDAVQQLTVSEYTIDNIRGKKYAIHCSTQEEWDAVTKVLGYTWGKYPSWDKHEENSAIDANRDEYSRVSYYTSVHYTIIPASQFLLANRPVQQEYKVEKDNTNNNNQPKTTKHEQDNTKYSSSSFLSVYPRISTRSESSRNQENSVCCKIKPQISKVNN